LLIAVSFALRSPYRPPLLALLFDVSAEYRMHQLHHRSLPEFWIRASPANATKKVSDVDLGTIEYELTRPPFFILSN
jgi:hypothetical protein